MRRWLPKFISRRARQCEQTGVSDSRYRAAILEAERVSAAAGMCSSGNFDRMVKGASVAALRRAVEFFIASSPREEFLEPWAANRSLLVYLRGVHPVPAVLTIGWYEVDACPMMEHSFVAAERAVKGPSQSLRRKGVHVWVTTRALQIVDVCMPTLLSHGSQHPAVPNTALIFTPTGIRSPILYHRTAVVGESSMPQEQHAKADRSATQAEGVIDG